MHVVIGKSPTDDVPAPLRGLWSRAWTYQCRRDDCQRVSPRSCHIGTEGGRMGVAVFRGGPRSRPVDGSASLHIPFYPLWYSKDRHKRNALRHLHTRHHLRCRRPTPIRVCLVTFVPHSAVYKKCYRRRKLAMKKAAIVPYLLQFK